MKNKIYDFSSTQIILNEELTQLILERGVDLIDSKDLSGDGFEDKPHITVLYGIHDLDPTPKLIEVVETYPKFTITLGNVSLFKTETHDIVKVDINCNNLYSLRSAFMNNCYFTVDFPEYIPHMTVAYVNTDSCDHLEGNPAFYGLSFVVEQIDFSCKDGIHRFISLGLR